MVFLSNKKGQVLQLHLDNAAIIAGLSLTDFTVVCYSNSATLSNTDISLSISEIGSTGHYIASATFSDPGFYYLSFVYSTAKIEYNIKIDNDDIEFLTGKIAGADGEYEFTVTDSSDIAISGVTVKLYESSGLKVITKGTTNASGKVIFSAPAGSYKVRAFKDGYDFSSINPTTITIAANSSLSPIISEFLPSTVTSSSTVCILGLHFTSSTVVFVNGSSTSISAVSSDGKAITLNLPSGLSTSVSLQAANPDSGNPGEFFKSKLYNVTVT